MKIQILGFYIKGKLYGRNSSSSIYIRTLLHMRYVYSSLIIDGDTIILDYRFLFLKSAIFFQLKELSYKSTINVFPKITKIVFLYPPSGELAVFVK